MDGAPKIPSLEDLKTELKTYLENQLINGGEVHDMKKIGESFSKDVVLFLNEKGMIVDNEEIVSKCVKVRETHVEKNTDEPDFSRYHYEIEFEVGDEFDHALSQPLSIFIEYSCLDNTTSPRIETMNIQALEDYTTNEKGFFTRRNINMQGI